MRRLTFVTPANEARMRTNMWKLRRACGLCFTAICAGRAGGDLAQTAYTIGNIQPPMRRLIFLTPANEARMHTNMWKLRRACGLCFTEICAGRAGEGLAQTAYTGNTW